MFDTEFMFDFGPLLTAHLYWSCVQVLPRSNFLFMICRRNCFIHFTLLDNTSHLDRINGTQIIGKTLFAQLTTCAMSVLKSARCACWRVRANLEDNLPRNITDHHTKLHLDRINSTRLGGSEEANATESEFVQSWSTQFPLKSGILTVRDVFDLRCDSSCPLNFCPLWGRKPIRDRVRICPKLKQPIPIEIRNPNSPRCVWFTLLFQLPIEFLSPTGEGANSGPSRNLSKVEAPNSHWNQ